MFKSDTGCCPARFVIYAGRMRAPDKRRKRVAPSRTVNNTRNLSPVPKNGGLTVMVVGRGANPFSDDLKTS